MGRTKFLAIAYVVFAVSLAAGQNSSIQFFVTTKAGEGLTGLRSEEVRVRDPNGARVSIADVSTEPLCVGVLFDTSNSSKWSDVESKRAILEQTGAFLRRHLRKGKDFAFVQMFDTQSVLLQGFTDDPDLLIQSFSRLTVGGGTAFFDAVISSSQRLDDPKCLRRVLLIASDGDDNQSSANRAQAVQAALLARVGVFALNMQDMEMGRGLYALNKLAGETGGAVLQANSRKWAEKSFKILNGVVAGTYLLQLHLPQLTAPANDRLQSLDVKISRGGVVVRMPRKYSTP
jgi:VWFA-related protein